jgi:hypothetical protein
MKFVPLDGVRGTLTASIKATDVTLPLSYVLATALDDKLVNDGDYTFLEITSGSDYEIVKIFRADGELTIERGSPAINAPKGACVGYGVNTAVVSALIGQGGNSPAVCEIVAGAGIKITKVDCKHTVSVEWPTCTGVDFMGATFKVVNGCLVVDEPNRCNCDPTDGTYENATVTIKKGRICAIQTGPNPQYLTPSCTCCNCST